jgi:multiple antibiotic resistance protein
LTAFLPIVTFAPLGKLLFDLFGITLPAFRIMGGVLVAPIGHQMLHGHQSAVHQPTSEDQKSSMETALSVAVTPMAILILAGPGTIATAMRFASGGGIVEVVITIAAFAILSPITFRCFIYGQRLVIYLGQAGLNVITRIMGSFSR